MVWLIPEFLHEKVVRFLKDPYNLDRDDRKRFWIFRFQFKGTSLFVRGIPSQGAGEAYALFSFSLWPLKSSEESRKAGYGPLDVFRQSRLVLRVEDIFVSPKGMHLGSYILNKVLKFVRLTVSFCGSAEIKGFLGSGNEIAPERISIREAFWKSFGVNVNYAERRIEGNLKEIVERYIKELPDVIEIELEKIL